MCKVDLPRPALQSWQLPYKIIDNHTNIKSDDEIQHALFNGIPCGPVGFDTKQSLGGLNVMDAKFKIEGSDKSYNFLFGRSSCTELNTLHGKFSPDHYPPLF